MKKARHFEIPEFKTLEEEREYWEKHGPLAEGKRGRIYKPRPGQKRSSFLAVRLTGEEITHLRDVAAKYGIGPSTFARLILTSSLQFHGKPLKSITLDELRNILEEKLTTPEIQDKAEKIFESISIGKPPFLLEISKIPEEEWKNLTLQFIGSLFASLGVEVVYTRDSATDKS